MSLDPQGGDFAIRCDNLSKSYRVYSRLIPGITRRVLWPRKPNPHVRTVEAVKNLSLQVGKGEVFGILGANGSGKSTLLACIAGITPVTSGSVHVAGKVEALLRLGVGFSPYFTGRENVVIGLIAMGSDVDDAKASVDDVLRFAEVESFADMPFYTYSSGMQARLQFSVAIHRTPEVLLLDEALSTGDGFFRSKASQRIEEVCRSGSTVLLVTHSISHVESLCDRAAILERGQIVATGSGVEIGLEYRAMESRARVERYRVMQQAGDTDHRPDSVSKEAFIIEAQVQSPDGLNHLAWNRPARFTIGLFLPDEVEDPHYQVEIYDAHTGVLTTNFGNWCVDPRTMVRRQTELGTLSGDVHIRFDVPALPLGGGTYFWSFALKPGRMLQALESESDHLVYQRAVGYFQVESFPEEPNSVGRCSFTEIAVSAEVEHRPSQRGRRA